MSKRQRIDAVESLAANNSDNNKKETNQRAFIKISNGCDQKHLTNENSTPLDILPTTNFGSNSTISANSRSNSNSPTSMPSSVVQLLELQTESASDELDNAATSLLLKHCDREASSLTENGNHFKRVDFINQMKTSPTTTASTTKAATTLISSNDSNVPTTTPAAPTVIDNNTILSIASNANGNGCLHPSVAASCSSSNSTITTTTTSTNNSNSNETSIRLSTNQDSRKFSSLNNVDEFQLYLMKQCLCNISERSLRRSFVTHYYKDMNGVKHSVALNEWPANKLIQFLSNIELLFEVYLNQNAKGEICTRVMQVCDALLLNEQNIIEDIFQLDEYNNTFVQYLAIKVLANCMLIAKDKEEYCDNLLTTLMSNLVVHHEPNDHIALGKISFILSIILHIMEWKDIRKHPLDDQIVINGRELYNDSDNENFTLPLEVPSLENNYFAVQHSETTDSSLASTSSRSTTHNVHSNSQTRRNDSHDSTTSGTVAADTSCQLQYLSDSESFDSKQLKYKIACALRIKWPHLVDNMAECISMLQTHHHLSYIETTIITFLTLWERIINVDTCISFDEKTMPFHEKLAMFEEILIRGNLPVSIYKQILTLFSASLCYTTTLALQSEVPSETNNLATEIFKSVKSQKIFTSLPKCENDAKHDIGFIGSTIYYSLHDDRLGHSDDDDYDDDEELNDGETDDLHQNHAQKSIDYILLQKLVLLILKAIVVTVRPIRSGDSSDSSMDSCSSASNSADAVALVVERATRDVFKKLKLFLKNKLNHHPETHLSKVIVHLFNNQDDYLIEAMLCMLGTTIAFLPRQPFSSTSTSSENRNTTVVDRNQFHELVDMISPVYTFLEFLELIHYDKQTMLDLLITDDTCFLLYFLRFLKYIRSDWQMFQSQCNDYLSTSNATRLNNRLEGSTVLERVMSVLIRLRLKLERLVLQNLFPYDISPMLVLMHHCESLYEGNDHELF